MLPILCIVLIREYGTWRSLVSQFTCLLHDDTICVLRFAFAPVLEGMGLCGELPSLFGSVGCVCFRKVQ